MNIYRSKTSKIPLSRIWAIVLTALVFGLVFGRQAVSAEANSAKTEASTSPNGHSDKKFDPQDVPRVIQYLKTHESKNLAPVLRQGRPSPSVSPTPTSSEPNQYYVQPILFVASDMSESQGNTTAINNTFQMLKRWYSGALEQNNSGFTFSVADTIVYHASQPFSYFKCPNHETSCDNYDGVWGNIQIELENAGYPVWSPGTSFVVFVKGAAGWAGSQCGPVCLVNWPTPGPASLDGFAILGDWALDAITGDVNGDCLATIGSACYLNPQRGAIGHELGHTFGLAHALDQTGSVMYSWWDFPYTSLFASPGNNEKDMLRAESKFFSPQACLPDNRIDQVTQPTSVKSKSQFITSFAVTNYGFCHWDNASVDLHIVRDDVWGIRLAQSGVTYPAQQNIFSLDLTAPALKGAKSSQTYDNIWQMRTAGKYFGTQMGAPVSVIRP